MHRTWNAFYLTLVVAGLAVSTGQAKVAPISFEKLIQSSDFIVLGQVTEVREISGVPFATVTVLESLKGDASNKVVYSAEKTWTCDISSAISGETALFFFNHYKIGPTMVRNREKSLLLESLFAEAFNVNKLFRLGHSGHGRFPLVTSPDGETVKISPSVFAPKTLGRSRQEVVDFTRKVLAKS